MSRREEDTTSLLARVPIFAGLSADELEQVADVAVPRSYARDQLIFREGEQGSTCYVIRSGSVRVTRRGSSHGPSSITLAELRFGDPFGELAMFDGEIRSATVQAIEDTEAIALLAADMRRLLLAHPDFALRLLALLAARVRTTGEMVTRQRFQTVGGRVASALLAQVEARLPEDAEADDVVVAATQAEIAQLAGASRESASRFLASLERSGLVTCGRGRVTVHDAGGLRNYIY